MTYEEKRKTGLYEKFTVTRTDGQSAPGEKHENCRYFVLDMNHDRFAWYAIAAYRLFCRNVYPSLADDLQRWLHEHPPTTTFDEAMVQSGATLEQLENWRASLQEDNIPTPFMDARIKELKDATTL